MPLHFSGAKIAFGPNPPGNRDTRSQDDTSAGDPNPYHNTFPIMSHPTSSRAWQFSSAKGGLENHLKLNPDVPLPRRKPNQHFVQG
ncbi:hypothetical protein BST61_g887 [Cercospora zeina]